MCRIIGHGRVGLRYTESFEVDLWSRERQVVYASVISVTESRTK